MASFDFSGLVSGLASAMPSQESVIQNVALSAASGVVLAGLKQQVGSGALDPIGLFHGNSVSATNNPNNITGPTATAAALNGMTGAAQAAFFAAGGHVVG